jgi:hypothetical protein
MVDLTFRKIAPDTYQKWNAVLGVRTTVTFDREGRRIHVRHDQPKQMIADVLDRNVAMQNDWKGRFGGDLVTQTASLPIVVHSQIMKQCGFQPGQGYDEKKFRQIMNDRDNYKLKCVPGKI